MVESLSKTALFLLCCLLIAGCTTKNTVLILNPTNLSNITPVDYVPYVGATGEIYTSYFVSARGINVTTDLGSFGVGITNENTGNTNLLVPSGSGTLMLNSDQRYNDTAIIGSLNSTKALAGSSASCTYGVANFTTLINAAPTVTCASAQAGGSRNINYSTAVITMNATSYNNTKVLLLYLPASKSYIIFCMMITRANVTTTGVQFRVNTTGTPTSVDISYSPYGSILGYTGTSVSSNAFNVLTSTVTYAPSSMSSYIVTSGSASVFSIEMRAEIAGTTAFVNKGSWCEAMQIQ
jgi:hypothetical protein